MEITSSISRIRLPRISSASSRPRYSRWVPAVVMEVSSTWIGSGIYALGPFRAEKYFFAPGLAGHLMNQGDALGLRRQHVVIVLRRDQLQKLPGAGHSQLRIAEHDKRADVQVIRHFADGQVPRRPATVMGYVISGASSFSFPQVDGAREAPYIII